MKTTILYIALALGAVAAIILIANYFQPKSTITDGPLTFFYGQECPHCKKVEKWMTDNKIEEKITINKKEVYHNQDNATEMMSIAKHCGLNTNNLGVPMVYDGEKCYSGEDEAMYIIKKKAGI